MAGVLTTASVVKCGHGESKVATANTAKLTVGRAPVLISSSIAGKSVSGCVTVDDPNTATKKCLSVTEVTAGQASKLTTGGQPVMLDTLGGATDGTVGGTLQTLLTATAGQAKLTAR
jgi:hypothetical protein